MDNRVFHLMLESGPPSKGPRRLIESAKHFSKRRSPREVTPRGGGRAEASLLSAANSPGCQRVRVVVNGRSQERTIVVEREYIDTKGAAIIRVDRELRHEGAIALELDQLARLVRVGVRAIAVGDQEIPIRQADEIERAVQMGNVGIDHFGGARGAPRSARRSRYRLRMRRTAYRAPGHRKDLMVQAR